MRYKTLGEHLPLLDVRNWKINTERLARAPTRQGKPRERCGERLRRGELAKLRGGAAVRNPHRKTLQAGNPTRQFSNYYVRYEALSRKSVSEIFMKVLSTAMLRDDVVNHVSGNVREPEIAATVPICQLCMINTHEIENGCMQIVHVNAFVDALPA